MDFSKFEKVDNTFDRKGGYKLVKEQEYSNLKYRRAVKKTKGKDGAADEEVIEGRFYVANERFESLGLATNGLRQFTAPDGETVLAVVADTDASILKSSKKSKNGNKVRNFKSPKLESALEKMKVINPALVGENQFIDLNSIATGVNIKGVSCIQVFSFAKGEAKPKAEKAEMEAAPVATTAQPVAAATDWN